MTDTPPKPHSAAPAPATDREARLAEALRANLRKRKAQSRAAQPAAARDDQGESDFQSDGIS